MHEFKGVLTALATPFKDHQVDVPSLQKLVKNQINGGIYGLVVLGTTAESPTLTHKEKKQIFDIVQSEVSGQVPLLVGIGSNSTSDTIEKAQEAISWGADALLCVVPYYNKPPQRGLLYHFQKISESAGDTPIILYNVPSRTITSLSLETIVSLSKCKNIIGIKEASGDIQFDKKLMNILSSKSQNFRILSGDDNTFDAFMEIKGDGIISVISNLLPSQTVDVYNAYVKGSLDEARSKFKELKKYIDILNFDTNPIPIKAALYLSKMIATPQTRSPLLPPEDRQLQKLNEDLIKLKQ